MMKLGQLLVEREWLSRPQLDQALNHQKLFGGRLGTCLLELNLLSEERLVKALSEQLMVPAVRLGDLRHLDPAVLEVVPAKVACRGRLIPFERFATEISVALRDVRDLSLQDELSFVTSKRVKVFVAPEVRILEALEKHYGCDVEIRYQRIWDRLNRARYLWQEETAAQPAEATVRAGAGAGGRPETAATITSSGTWTVKPPPELDDGPSPPAPPEAPAAAPRPAPAEVPNASQARASEQAPAGASSDPGGVPSLRPREVEVPEEFRAALATPPTLEAAQPVAPSDSPQTLDELRRSFDAAEQRDEIAEALLGFLLHRCPRALLFMVRGSEVNGWMGGGEGVDQARLLAFELGFDTPSFFLNLREGSPFFRGPLIRVEGHQRLAEVWDGKLPREAVVLPVRLRKRLVAAIYCDGVQEPVEADLAELQEVAESTARAFEQLLVRRKRLGEP